MVSRRIFRAVAILTSAVGLLALSGCGLAYRAATGQPERAGAPAPPAPLTAEEKAWARNAWRYFAENDNAATGLVNSVDQYPTATAWEMADTMAALIAARDLGLLPAASAQERLARILAFAGRMELAYGRLPNRVYNAATGVAAIDADHPGNAGWSAVDTGRLLVWLRALADREPALASAARAVVARFDLCAAIGADGGLTGGAPAGPAPARYREAGRGYEDYAAAGYRLWGMPARPPRLSDPVVKVDGVGFVSAVPDHANEFTPVVTGDSVLQGLEFGWAAPATGDMAKRARSVELAQRTRMLQEGVATARNDYLRSTAPYFLYGTVVASGRPWAVLTPEGTETSSLALVSAKAALGLWAFWPERWNDLVARLSSLSTARGWQEGIYEASGKAETVLSASTNAVILEVLAYRARGPLLTALSSEPARTCAASAP
ncbi:uncharacterized protein DUF3131 [Nitrospirillum amazonense]|uniref:Uncharacterized protein DUF3131 n=1 Tax=Nitrospirillum amazonense TaxID=28077 RepID=A0A560K9P8_9PROT|nr:DUF3131 domain-containing protein [Nitrospirillum amazonense]TWB80041.1 uncharacterized protein DUF3131 [Nitrospirillum amazonense]